MIEADGLVDDSSNKKAIVVVEDNEAIADMLKELLNDEPDYQPVAVNDGALALDVIHSVKASLINLDYRLPSIDGLKLYDLLQEDEQTKNIPVLFITSDSEDPAFSARNHKDILAKPFELDELLSRVAKHCRTE